AGAAATEHGSGGCGKDDAWPDTGARLQVRLLPRRRSERRATGSATRRPERGLPADEPQGLQDRWASRLLTGDVRGALASPGRRSRCPCVFRGALPRYDAGEIGRACAQVSTAPTVFSGKCDSPIGCKRSRSFRRHVAARTRVFSRSKVRDTLIVIGDGIPPV